jgi:hypothetical protein
MLLRVGYGRGPGPASPVEASYPRRALQRPHEPDMHLPTLLPDGKPGSREQELERDAPLMRTVAGLLRGLLRCTLRLLSEVSSESRMLPEC